MRVVIIGQQDFGKATLDAFLNRGDVVSAVFCAPEREGARPDALRRVGAAPEPAIERPEHGRQGRVLRGDLGHDQRQARQGRLTRWQPPSHPPQGLNAPVHR